MKKIVLFFAALIVLSVCCSVKISAEQIDDFDAEIRQIEDSVDDEVSNDMETLGMDSVEKVIANGVEPSALFQYLIDLLSAYSSGPLSALVTLTAVLLLSSIVESYTFSLRYTETKDIMGVVVALFVCSVVISPITELVALSGSIIKGASVLMSVYLPVMAGILAFSGHAIASGGYYAAVTLVSQLISRIASKILAPLLNVFLSLSVSAGICTRVRFSGLIDMIGKAFKYVITFSMSVFIAVLGLNSALSGAADGVADKAVKYGLSSFIPIIGSSVSEAYSALRSSVNILRSGIGVFVVIAVFVSFAPLMIRTLLWSAAVGIAKMIGEMLSVSSASAVLNTLSVFLSAFRAMVVSVAVVFIISSSIMITIGGQV